MSYATAQILLRGGSIYSIKLMRRGVYLDPLQPILNRVPVKEAMHEDVVAVSSKMPISEVRDLIARYNYTGFPVVSDGELSGMITFDDLRRVPLNTQEETLVEEVATKNTIFVYPDQSVKYAMDLMYQNRIGRLPVVRGDGSIKGAGRDNDPARRDPGLRKGSKTVAYTPNPSPLMRLAAYKREMKR